MAKPTDLVQGTLDLLILKTISLEPKHGWAIAKRIQQVSREALQIQQGSLYPALHRLEQQGWIKSEWRPTGDGSNGQVLLAHPVRSASIRGGVGELGSTIVSDQSRNSGGLTCALRTNSVYVYARCSSAATWSVSSKPSFGYTWTISLKRTSPAAWRRTRLAGWRNSRWETLLIF